MNIGEKVAYLKGLAEGLDISPETKEGKLLKAMLDVLGDIAAYAEELDEDLGALEQAFVESNDYEYAGDGGGYEDFADLEGSAKIDCPECGELVLFDFDDIENGAVECPGCAAGISVVGEYSSEDRQCGGCRGHPQPPEQEDGDLKF